MQHGLQLAADGVRLAQTLAQTLEIRQNLCRSEPFNQTRGQSPEADRRCSRFAYESDLVLFIVPLVSSITPPPLPSPPSKKLNIENMKECSDLRGGGGRVCVRVEGLMPQQF